MKKKLTISVADLMNKNCYEQQRSTKNQASLKPKPLCGNSNIVNAGSNQKVFEMGEKPIRFEDMYQQVRKNSGSEHPQTYIYESKKNTPIQSQRLKKGSINSLLAGSSHKSNKTTAPRMMNPRSGSTSVNQSSRQTPEHKTRKNSINSIVMNKENQKN